MNTRQKLQQAAASVVLGGLDGETLSEREEAFLVEARPSGLTLFNRNISTSDPLNQVSRLTSRLHEILGVQLGRPLIAIDQEGGRVARLRGPGIPEVGPALTAFGGEVNRQALDALEDYGRATGELLSRLGVSVNFAPVVDVLTHPENHSIGDRCFGKDPRTVTLRAGSYLRGLQSQGVFGCLKHFPGQGGADADTHLVGVEIKRARSELEALDVAPFSELIGSAHLVMTSHCCYSAWDLRWEASLSKLIIQDLLRAKLGFEGLVITDDLTMGALRQSGQRSWAENCIQAIWAGSDVLLVCQGLELWQEAIACLSQAAWQDSDFAVQLQTAANRVQRLRQQGLPAMTPARRESEAWSGASSCRP